MADVTIDDLNAELNRIELSPAPDDVEAVYHELTEGLGLSAETTADLVDRYQLNHDGNIDAQDIRNDMETYGKDMADAISESRGVPWNILNAMDDSVYDIQGSDGWRSYVEGYIGDEAYEYLTIDPEDDAWGSDAELWARDIVEAAGCAYLNAVTSGSYEDYKQMEEALDGQDPLGPAISFGCQYEVVTFVAENGGTDGLADLLYGYFDDDVLEGICGDIESAVKAGTFSESFDVAFIERAMSEVEGDYILSDEQKEELCGIIIEGDIYDPGFEGGCEWTLHDLGDAKDALDSYYYGELDMIGESTPDELKDRISAFFDDLREEHINDTEQDDPDQGDDFESYDGDRFEDDSDDAEAGRDDPNEDDDWDDPDEDDGWDDVG